MKGRPQPSGDGRHQVARGVGTAILGRAGAVIEVVSQPVFTRLFGLATYGIYITLWSYVRLATAIADLAMSTALQRYGAGAESDDVAHRVAHFAILLSTSIAIAIAAITTVFAEPLAAVLNAAPEDRETLPHIIVLYVWSLPLWTFIEVATAAVRARHAFGPEIRVRIFYEQGSRLVFAVAFFLFGWQSYGLFLAHLASLLLAATLSVRLLARYYDFKALLRVRPGAELRRELAMFGVVLMPANLIKRLFSDLPPVALNIMLPGVAGAEAAGLYGIARKIASVMQIVRLSFEYVLAPLTATHARAERRAVLPIYAFATRLATVMILPLATLVVLLRAEIAAIFGAAAVAAAPLIAVLTVGRALETLTGPSAAVLEVLDNVRLPLIINLGGFLVAAVLAALLTPALGALGMAVAVAIGLNAVAWTSLAVLARRQRLMPYDLSFLRTLVLGLAGGLILIAISSIFSGPVEIPLLVVAMIAFYGAAARWGLSADDRLALRRTA